MITLPFQDRAVKELNGKTAFNDILAFIKSKTPREFFVEKYCALLASDAAIDRFQLPDELRFLQVNYDLARVALSEDLLIAVIQKLVPETRSIDEAVSLIRETGEAATISPGCHGIYADVEGTLIDEDGLTGFYSKLVEAKSAGLKVTIFTGGDPNRLGEKLRALGVDQQFLPIRSKSEFAGKTLEIIIDDTVPFIQRLATPNYVDPNGSWWDQLSSLISKANIDSGKNFEAPLSKEVTEVQAPAGVKLQGPRADGKSSDLNHSLK